MYRLTLSVYQISDPYRMELKKSITTNDILLLLLLLLLLLSLL